MFGLTEARHHVGLLRTRPYIAAILLPTARKIHEG